VAAVPLPAGFTAREATPADAPAIGRAVAEGFGGFRSFAPAGWRPPVLESEVLQVRDLLAAGDLWCLLASRDGAPAGHVGFLAAARSIAPVDDPGLAHFRQLFVEPRWWGAGLAPALHTAAVEEAQARGYTAMRLFTPAGQARARRFYEREGWLQAGPPRDSGVGLPTVEYRRALG
jgi:GNAT superfamily N-acetyltransferase